MKLKQGHEFHGPDGQGYRLTRDVQTGEAIMADTFKPFGGAPPPQAGHSMPQWLAARIREASEGNAASRE